MMCLLVTAQFNLLESRAGLDESCVKKMRKTCLIQRKHLIADYTRTRLLNRMILVGIQLADVCVLLPYIQLRPCGTAARHWINAINSALFCATSPRFG